MTHDLCSLRSLRTTCVPWKVTWHLYFCSMKGCFLPRMPLWSWDPRRCLLSALHIAMQDCCKLYLQSICTAGSPRHSVTPLQPLMDWALHYKLSSELQVLPFQQKHRAPPASSPAVAVLCIAMRLAGSAGLCTGWEGWLARTAERPVAGWDTITIASMATWPPWPYTPHQHTRP